MTPPLDSRRRMFTALLATLLFVGPGCTVGNYAGDRFMDLTDIIDIKYGTAIGVGAKVEITQYMGAGAGAAALGYSREWYGRRSMEMNGFAFVHAGVIGVDGGYGSPNPNGWSNERAEVYFLLVNGTAFADFEIAPGGDGQTEDTVSSEKLQEQASDVADDDTPDFERLPSLAYWRFGGEVIIPSVQFGIYFNFGELVDFVSGIFGGDPARDDELSFFDTFNIEQVERDGPSVLDER
jgi:hypothetical protein